MVPNCSEQDWVSSVYRVVWYFPKQNNCNHDIAWILAVNPYTGSGLRCDTKLSPSLLKELVCSPLFDIIGPGWITFFRPNANLMDSGKINVTALLKEALDWKIFPAVFHYDLKAALIITIWENFLFSFQFQLSSTLNNNRKHWVTLFIFSSQ